MKTNNKTKLNIVAVLLMALMLLVSVLAVTMANNATRHQTATANTTFNVVTSGERINTQFRFDHNDSEIMSRARVRANDWVSMCVSFNDGAFSEVFRACPIDIRNGYYDLVFPFTYLHGRVFGASSAFNANYTIVFRVREWDEGTVWGHLGSGIGISNPINLITSLPLPPDPIPPVGFYFSGWYLDELNTIPFVVGSIITSDMNLYAGFRPINFDINFMLNGGSFTVTPTNTFTMLSPNTPLDTPNRTGFTFDGWFNNSTLAGQAITYIASGTVGNQRLYARWVAIEYTININLNGGNLVSTVPATYTIQSPIIVIPNPTRQGFTFAGWYNNPSFADNQISSILAGSTGTQNFYARWTVINFTITYNLNGGEFVGFTPITSFTVENDLITLPVPAREGYTFGGWFNNANLTGVRVEELPAGSVNNRTLFARWNVILHRVTFFVNGVIFSEIYVPHGLRLSNYSLLASGTSPVAVYTNAELTNTANLDRQITAPVVLFASQPFGVHATLEFIVNGRIVRTETILLNSFLDDLGTYEREGYEFLGWYTSSSFTMRVTDTTRLSSNMRVYGRFAPIVEYEPAEPTGLPSWAIWLIVGGSLILVGAIAIKIVVRKKKGKRK